MTERRAATRRRLRPSEYERLAQLPVALLARPPIAVWEGAIRAAAVLGQYGITVHASSDEDLLRAYQELYTRTGLHPVEAWQRWQARKEAA